MGVETRLIEKPEKYSDCRLFSILLFLKYYGIDVDEETVFGLGCGMDNNVLPVLINQVKLHYPIGRRINCEKEFLLNHCNGVIVETISDARKSVERIIEIVNEGNPVIVSLDRFYLDYLQIKPAHIGFHTIVVIEIEEDKFFCLDALCPDRVMALSIDSFIKAVSSRPLIGNESEIIYCLNKPTILDNSGACLCAIKQNVNELLGAEINMKHFADYMISLGESEDQAAKRYLYIQRKMFFESFFEQDTQKSFYRKTYCEFLKRYVPHSFAHFIDGFLGEYMDVLSTIKSSLINEDSAISFLQFKKLVAREENFLYKLKDNLR